MTYFADLHCHPTGKTFQEHSTIKEKDFYQAEAHPWNIPESKRKHLGRGCRATQYSQSDFARLLKGNVKLVFAALYPLEQGILNKIKNADCKIADFEPIISDEEIMDIKDEMEYADIHNVIIEDDDDFNRAPGAPGILGPLILGMPHKRIRYIRSERYDYWTEMMREYEFLKRKSGILSDRLIYFDYDDDAKVKSKEKETVKGTYYLLTRNREKENLSNKWGQQSYCPFSKIDSFIKKKDTVIVIPTIEGMNVLSMSNQACPVSDDLLIERIKELKKMDPPIFFITLAHHFNNNICAHAHSLPKIALFNPDQTKNMNHMGESPHNGINALGIAAIKEMLEIEEGEDGFLTDRAIKEWRIHVDVKHMSASARLEYYEKIIRPYNNNLKNDGKKIPIIASHMGYSGRERLKEQILNYNSEENLSSTNGFNNWNINLCDEDVQEIVASEGLIGLTLDERILGQQSKIGLGCKKPKNKEELIVLVERTLKSILLAAKKINKHKYLKTEFTVWNTLCIGTDHDGYIDPIDDYPTVAEFPEFSKDLEKKLLEWSDTDRKEFGIDKDSELKSALDKFFGENGYKFLKDHYGK
ncbi:MAG: hypothetical protein AAF149_20305 [Bacteroidota bacterium]